MICFLQNSQEEMKMGLRGGGAGDVCCGVYVLPPLFPFLYAIMIVKLIVIL